MGKLGRFLHKFVPILRPVLRVLGVKGGTVVGKAAEIAEKIEEASRK